jgi:death-on-curing protein
MLQREPVWLSLDALLIIQQQQIERFGGQSGILDRNVVESALARPRNVFAYRDDADLSDLAAAYLFGFAAKQGFVDGNKRIGVASMLVFLDLNGRPLHVEPPELYRVAIGVARNEMGEAEVAEWLRRVLEESA